MTPSPITSTGLGSRKKLVARFVSWAQEFMIAPTGAKSFKEVGECIDLAYLGIILSGSFRHIQTDLPVINDYPPGKTGLDTCRHQ